MHIYSHKKIQFINKKKFIEYIDTKLILITYNYLIKKILEKFNGLNITEFVEKIKNYNLDIASVDIKYNMKLKNKKDEIIRDQKQFYFGIKID